MNSQLGSSPNGQISLPSLLDNLLSAVEIEQIKQQFDLECRIDSQVLWSGVTREVAQAWADKRNLQTLTTAMGSLMDVKHSSCLKQVKTPKQWSLYIKGASALFASHIARRSSKVTVLLPPPPEMLNPTGHTNYQLVEEPIIKGLIGGYSVGCIELVHPMVKGAEEFRYETWPINREDCWSRRFPLTMAYRISWRPVKMTSEIRKIVAIITVAKEASFHSDHIPSPSYQEQSSVESISGIILEEMKLAVSQPQDTDQGLKANTRDLKAQRKRANEKMAQEARRAKALRKKAQEKMDEKAREAKLESKKAQEKIVMKAKEAKLEKKRAHEEMEKRAREAKLERKRAHEEMVKKAREVKLKKKRAHEKMEKRAREVKLQNREAYEKMMHERIETLSSYLGCFGIN